MKSFTEAKEQSLLPPAAADDNGLVLIFPTAFDL